MKKKTKRRAGRQADGRDTAEDIGMPPVALPPKNLLILSATGGGLVFTVNDAALIENLVTSFGIQYDFVAQADGRFAEIYARDVFVAEMVNGAAEYIGRMAPVAFRDALRQVLLEATRYQATTFATRFGYGPMAIKEVLPARDDLLSEAAKLMAARIANQPFSHAAPPARWTSRSLAERLLAVMGADCFKNAKLRTKMRVAAAFYDQNFDSLTRAGQRGCLSNLNALLRSHGVDYLALERADDRRRSSG